MKKIGIILVALLAIVVFVSCDTNEESADNKIESISYHLFGGEMGYSEELTITIDSVHYSRSSSIPLQKKEIRVSTPEKLWENLLKKCNLAAFAKIKNGESNRPLDGLDQVFTIKMKEKELSVVNGYGNEYEQLHDFFNLIMQELYRHQLKINELEKEFCSFVNSENMDKLSSVINTFLSDLSENLSDEQKLEALTQWLKSYSCITDAKILCNSCVKTLPAQSEIAISFIENKIIKTFFLDISMSNPLKFAGCHEVLICE